LFAILQKYDFPSKSQHHLLAKRQQLVVCDTAKVRFSKQITTSDKSGIFANLLFAILQKYDFPSKSQLKALLMKRQTSCLRYCKSTIFQANHNSSFLFLIVNFVVCDTAKVRFSKQITTKI